MLTMPKNCIQALTQAIGICSKTAFELKDI